MQQLHVCSLFHHRGALTCFPSLPPENHLAGNEAKNIMDYFSAETNEDHHHSMINEVGAACADQSGMQNPPKKDLCFRIYEFMNERE